MSDKAKQASVAHRFINDRDGSVATIAALAMIPLIIAVGAGVDISRAMTSRSSVQDALDATALALAHLPTGTKQEVLNQKAAQWMAANMADKNVSSYKITVTPAKGQIFLQVDGKVPTTLSAIAGITEMPIKSTSTVKWGLSHVEIALVLDNTGSMAGTKISTLKTAATSLIDTLVSTSDTTDPNSLKVSVVPFSHTVNIGSTYKNETWMDPTAAGLTTDIFNTVNTNRYTILSNLGKTYSGCVESRVMPYDVQDTAPSTGTPATLFVPYFAPDEPDDTTTDRRGNVSDVYPNNYLLDKTGTTWQEKQGNVAKYTPKADTMNCGNKKNKACNNAYDPKNAFAGSGNGPNDGCDMTTVLRLTTDMAKVKTKIGQMVATGNTNVAMGMMWGWHTLSPNLPFKDGVAYSTENTKKIMVVLTDGDNTNTTTDASIKNNSTYSGLGYIWQNRLGALIGINSTSSQRTTAMDERMAALCTNAKKTGVDITIYTVRIDQGGAAPPALMNCASDGQFYDVPQVADLSKAFDSIAGAIGELRIAE